MTTNGARLDRAAVLTLGQAENAVLDGTSANDAQQEILYDEMLAAVSRRDRRAANRLAKAISVGRQERHALHTACGLITKLRSGAAL